MLFFSSIFKAGVFGLISRLLERQEKEGGG